MDTSLQFFIVELFLCVCASPFLHGLLTSEYVSFYTFPHVLRITAIEVLVLYLKSCKQKLLSDLFSVFPFLVLLSVLSEEFFGLRVFKHSWICTFIAQHICLREVLCLVYELLIYTIDVVEIALISQLTVTQFISFCFCRILLLVTTVFFISLILVMNIVIIPHLFFKDYTLTLDTNTNLNIEYKSTITFTRFLGEDVLMTCSSGLDVDSIETEEVLWTFNERVVHGDQRHALSVHKSKHSNVYSLTVMNISVVDYGE